MKKLLLALVIVILVTIPFALADDVTVATTKVEIPTGLNVTVSASVINLTTETLELGTYTASGLEADKAHASNSSIKDGATFKMAAYSVGGKWKAGTLAAKDVEKFLNKGGELVITDNWDKKGKAPGEFAITITFAEVGARPKANPDKVKPYYISGINGAGDDANFFGQWVIIGKDAWAETTAANALETAKKYGYAISSDEPNGVATKTSLKKGNATWTSFEEAIPVIDGKAKDTYLMRVPAGPNTDGKLCAGSKEWKVTPANAGKAPKAKADYKKEVLKIKPAFNIDLTLGSATNTSLDLKALTEDQIAAKEVAIGSTITNVEAPADCIYIQIGATGKKPSTAVQALKLLPRAAAKEAKLDAKGKITAGKWEFSSDSGATFAKASKFTTAGTYWVREVASKTAAAGNWYAITVSVADDGKVTSVPAATQP